MEDIVLLLIYKIKMNCSYCQCQFDHSVHTPKLLIFCGHSLCQKCCHQLHSNSRIQCPECLSNTFIEEVKFLPKNLALLKVNTISNNNGYCLKHEKKYEAFCKKEKVLICVDCILQDNHRNHEMDSIRNSHVQEDGILRETISNLQSLLNRVQSKYDENLNNEKECCDSYQLNCENTRAYFDEIRALIDREQEQHVARMRDQHDATLAKFQDKNRRFTEKIQMLSVSLMSLKEATHLSDIQFLSSVNSRQQVLANINTNAEDSFKSVNGVLTKNTVADMLIKSIQKCFKTVPNAATTAKQQGNKTPPANLKSKKNSSQHGQQVQTLKQYESVQIPSSQKLNPMTKKNSKKDPIIASPASVSSSLNGNKSSLPNPLTKISPNIEPQKKSSVYLRPKANQKQKFDIGKNCDISIVQNKQSLFNSFFSNMTSFLAEQKQIYVIGGFDEQSSNVIKFNLSTFQWEEVANLKSPRSKFGCAVVDKNIFILGGKKGKERVSDVQIWNSGNWKPSCNLRKKRSGFGIISYEHFIYIIGGNDGENILSTVQILNTLSGEWIRAESMSEPRDELAACMGKDNRIYAIGGFGGKNNESLRTAEAFDIVAQRWQKVPSMHVPRRALAAASLADGIYAIGGFDGVKHLGSVQKYEEGSSEWVRMAQLKRGRCTHSAISIFESQQIIIMGGFDEEALDSVEKYSLITNQWQEIARMPQPRFMHSSVLFCE